MVPALTGPQLEVLDDEEAVARRAAVIFQETSPRKVVLAGGTTPKRAYQLISLLPLRWEKIDLFLSDERFVPVDDERSNERMIREALGARAKEAVIHGIFRETSAEEAAERYAAEVEPVLPFDLTFLGIGADGHTASLFPEDPRHDRTDVLAFAVPGSVFRVTLSLAALNQSRRVVFLVTGGDKANALAATIKGKLVPAANVRPIGEISILADEAAARSVGEIPPK